MASVVSSANGALDTDFGNLGLVETHITYGVIDGEPVPSDTVWTMAIQPDGKILLGGDNIDYYTIMARYNPDGSLDESFGTGGKVAMQVGSAYDLKLQTDGKIVLFGADYTTATLNDFLLVRFLDYGSLDLDF